jgi:hypothetical protein
MNTQNPSYLVPSDLVFTILKFFKQYKRIHFKDFKTFCINQHPELNTFRSKKLLYKAFQDVDNINNGWLDFDHFLIAYAFAFKEARMIDSYHLDLKRKKNKNSNNLY